MNNEKAFDDWWNGDNLPPNPYAKDSPVFWAWAGWVMGVKAENERLREALKKYGQHLGDCALTLGGYQCTCGFKGSTM